MTTTLPLGMMMMRVIMVLGSTLVAVPTMMTMTFKTPPHTVMDF